jgi:hypothetical protein
MAAAPKKEITDFKFLKKDLELMEDLTKEQREVLMFISKCLGETTVAYKMMGIDTQTFYLWRKNKEFDNLVNRIEAHYFMQVYSKVYIPKIMKGDAKALDKYINSKGKKYGISEGDLPVEFIPEGENLTDAEILTQYIVKAITQNENQSARHKAMDLLMAAIEKGTLRSETDGALGVGNINVKDLLSAFKQMRRGNDGLKDIG